MTWREHIRTGPATRAAPRPAYGRSSRQPRATHVALRSGGWAVDELAPSSRSAATSTRRAGRSPPATLRRWAALGARSFPLATLSSTAPTATSSAGATTSCTRPPPPAMRRAQAMLIIHAGCKVDRALRISCGKGHAEVTRLLLQAGADVAPAAGPTPLAAARAAGALDCVRLCIDANADVERVGDFGVVATRGRRAPATPPAHGCFSRRAPR